MFDRLIRRYKLGKAAEQMYFELRHHENGRVVYLRFEEILDQVTNEEGTGYCVYIKGQAELRGVVRYEAE